MKRFLSVLAGVALFTASANAATLRLYFSDTGVGGAGTGDDATGNIAFAEPNFANTNTNPTNVNIDTPKDLYLWAEMIGGGTQKWAGVGFNIKTEGTAKIQSFQFWNYSNGGGFVRWDGTGNNAFLGGDTNMLIDDIILAAVSQSGINSGSNTTGNAGPDFQYFNGGSTNRHVVIGRVTFNATTAGNGAAYIGVGQGGIARDTGAVERVYFGHGDEASFLLGNSKNLYTPTAEATFVSTIPEPASLILLGIAGLMLRRR